MNSIRTMTKCWFNFPQATVLCFECVCVLLVRMFDIHQVLWCRFYVNSKLHIWKTNWWNVNLSPSIFFLSSYLHNGLKYFLEEHFHQIHICGTFILHEYVDPQRMNALLTKYAGSPANIFNSWYISANGAKHREASLRLCYWLGIFC